jgi:hypothetical protein
MFGERVDDQNSVNDRRTTSFSFHRHALAVGESARRMTLSSMGDRRVDAAEQRIHSGDEMREQRSLVRKSSAPRRRPDSVEITCERSGK